MVVIKPQWLNIQVNCHPLKQKGTLIPADRCALIRTMQTGLPNAFTFTFSFA